MGEFRLPAGWERVGPGGTVHGAGLDIDGRNDVVAARDVLRHLLDQIALAAAIPKVMMRVDDRARRIDDFFFPQCQPVFARIGIEPAFRSGGVAGGHRSSLLERVRYLSSRYLGQQSRGSALRLYQLDGFLVERNEGIRAEPASFIGANTVGKITTS